MQKSRGRPTKSEIRQNIVNLLYYIGEGYGYQICKIYKEVFPPVTQRSIYYHLKKGVETGEILIHKIKEEQGEFSWGSKVEKTYYGLATNATPQPSQAIKERVLKVNKK